MPQSLIPDAGGDPRNASYLATMADLVYFPEAVGVPKIKDELGLDSKLISVKNTQAYVGVDDDHLVVCFRGSENPATLDGLKDWLLTNALNLLVIPDGELGQLFMEAGAGARYHQGFVHAINDIAPPLLAEVEARLREKDRLVWVAGHSLGGALAMMASWLFLKKTIPVHQIYTYGAPMVGIGMSPPRSSASMAVRFSATSTGPIRSRCCRWSACWPMNSSIPKGSCRSPTRRKKPPSSTLSPAW